MHPWRYVISLFLPFASLCICLSLSALFSALLVWKSILIKPQAGLYLVYQWGELLPRNGWENKKNQLLPKVSLSMPSLDPPLSTCGRTDLVTQPGASTGLHAALGCARRGCPCIQKHTLPGYPMVWHSWFLAWKRTGWLGGSVLPLVTCFLKMPARGEHCHRASVFQLLSWSWAQPSCQQGHREASNYLG